MTARDKLNQEIATVKARIASYDYSLERSKAAGTRFSEIMNGNISDLDADQKAELRRVMDECVPFLGLANDVKYLADLEETAKQQLIESPAERILVPHGKKLVSPAGFHPNDEVFVIVDA